MAYKKIVFVIVEGPSDQDAIGSVLSRIMNGKSVVVHVVRGDITTQNCGKRGIADRLKKIIKVYADNNSYFKSDFCEIVHLTDTDGVFIDKKYISGDKNAKKTTYTDKNIITSNVYSIVMRNRRKSNNLQYLTEIDRIWGIPYSIYYMSCNLDHVLYGKLNSKSHEKTENALNFAEKYRENTAGFIDFMTNSAFAVSGDYDSSWEYIKKERNSLDRHSNFCIYLAGVDS